jgi:tetratricopeptide (TPR) repeat protein/DNA-binding XRE family transcriptional regulator
MHHEGGHTNAMNSGDLPIFGTLLKAFRIRRYITQQCLAATVGVHRSTIGRWEGRNLLPATRGIVLELARHLHLDTQETRQLLEASLTAPPPLFLVPYPRNPFFTGRDEIMKALHLQLDRDRAIALTQSSALHGLGGVGKTQIALEYAYRYMLEYSAVFWIGAETTEHIISSFLRIAEILQVAERNDKDQQQAVGAVQRWLNTHNGWLLIWDNVEDPDLLLRFLPAVRNGATLLTTRNAAPGAFAQAMDLLPMGREEGTLFLLRRAKLLSAEATATEALQLASSTPEQYTAAEGLVSAMGGLPLALDQVGAYSEETGCSLSDYLRRYHFHQTRLLDRRGKLSGYHPHSVSTTFKLALEQVEYEHRAAAEVLRVCALLHAEGIPEEIFIMGATRLELDLIIADTTSFDKVMAVLQSLSLLQHQPETRTLSLHRLVQAVVREWMDEQEHEQWQRRLLTVLNALFPEDPFTACKWEQCERLLAHVLLVTAADPHCTDSAEQVEVLCKAADYLHERARYEQAEALYQRAIDLGELLSGREHDELARALDGLAFLCGEQGKYGHAEELGSRALRLREEALGPEHPHVAHSLNTLAILYTEQGKYTQAEPLLRQAIRIWEHTAGPDAPQMATPLNRLGLLYWRQGKYQQAEPLLKRATRIWEQAGGPDTLEVASSLNTLALLYWKQGKYAQAESLFQRIVCVEEQAHGPEHPLLAYTLTGQSILYAEQGKYAQAEPLFWRTLQIWEHTWGPDHHQVATSLLNLGELAVAQGKYTQAEPLLQRALRIKELVWGPEHLQMASSLDMLADLYTQQEKYTQAEVLFRRALQIWEQQSEPEHPDLASLLTGLASSLREQGRETEAEALFQRALRLQEQHLGQVHPEIAHTLYALALLRQRQGRLCEARSLVQRALQIQEQVLGATHPKTVATDTLYRQLQVPQTGAFSANSDPLQAFLAACCELHPLARCTIRELWNTYEHWSATVEGCVSLSRRDFAIQLKARGCQVDRTSVARIWRGIQLVQPLLLPYRTHITARPSGQGGKHIVPLCDT